MTVNDGVSSSCWALFASTLGKHTALLLLSDANKHDKISGRDRAGRHSTLRRISAKKKKKKKKVHRLNARAGFSSVALPP